MRTMRFASFIARVALTAITALNASAQGWFATGGLSPDCFSLWAVAMTPYDVNTHPSHWKFSAPATMELAQCRK